MENDRRQARRHFFSAQAEVTEIGDGAAASVTSLCASAIST